MSVPFSIPNHKQPLVPSSQTGLMSREWFRFFADLFQSTGAGQISLSGLPTSVAGIASLAEDALTSRNLEAQVDNLQQRIAQLESYVFAREV